MTIAELLTMIHRSGRSDLEIVEVSVDSVMVSVQGEYLKVQIVDGGVAVGRFLPRLNRGPLYLTDDPIALQFAEDMYRHQGQKTYYRRMGVNSHIKFKPTESGQKMLDEAVELYMVPEPDASGRVTMLLWQWCAVFNEKCSIGSDTFCTDMLIEVEPLP